MRLALMFLLLGALLLGLADPGLSAADALTPIMQRFSPYSMAAEKPREINALFDLPFEVNYPPVPTTAKLVLMLVEPRVLEAGGNPALQPALIHCLRRFKGDLRAQGFFSHVIAADLYRGTDKIDGRIVLALRRFFIEVKRVYPNFAGAILVGNFPAATLVWRISWAPEFDNPRKVEIQTELINERSNLVLEDLDGNWESRYVQNPFTAECIAATPDASTTQQGWYNGARFRDCTFTSTTFTMNRGKTFVDGFYIDDARYDVLQHAETPNRQLQLRLYERAVANFECNDADKTLPNPLARPEIVVSNINAYHIAVNPDPTLKGENQKTFLDANGFPQIVTSAESTLFNNPERENLFSYKDFDLERRMLISYFERNHRFRVGGDSYRRIDGALVTSSDFAGYANRDRPLVANALRRVQNPQITVLDSANLVQYTNFMKLNALIKVIHAHSSAWASTFPGHYLASDLEAATEGKPFRWEFGGTAEGRGYTPSFINQYEQADLFIYRTLWERNACRNAGDSIIIHCGCNVNSVNDVERYSFTHPRYAHWSNSEGLLFGTNCLAIVSRAKGFNDIPDGITDPFGQSDSATLGDGMKNFYDGCARQPDYLFRKRAYFWDLNGDWTLNLRPQNGLGILGSVNQYNTALGSLDVFPDRSNIDGWILDTARNAIRGCGDVDGDGIDEFVISSDWGMAILKYNGAHFTMLRSVPRDAMLGDWQYDSTRANGRDQLKDVRNYIGSANQEMLLWGADGMVAVEYAGGALRAGFVARNGWRIGEWLLDTQHNTYAGSGRFVSGAHTAMVLQSPWGIGIVSLEEKKTLYLAPHKTALPGNWRLGVDDRVRVIADFDGDGQDELFVSSPWGIGVLKFLKGQLFTVTAVGNGTSLGGYIVNNADNFLFADTFRGGAKHDLLVLNTAGLHLLTLDNNRLTRVAFTEQGQGIGDSAQDPNQVRVLGLCPLNPATVRISPAGDLYGNGRSVFLVQDPRWLAVVRIDQANHFQWIDHRYNDAMLVHWLLQPTDQFVGAGHFTAAARQQLLVMKRGAIIVNQ